MKLKKTRPKCACNQCNKYVTWNKHKKCWNKFIKGHHRKTIKASLSLSKLCECGCGDYAKPGNMFIHGHRIGIKLKSPSQPCECGCEGYTNPGRRFIKGHHNPRLGTGKKKKIKRKRFCACGCGYVTQRGNKYIHGHNSQKYGCWKLKPSKSVFQFCACGCGENAKPGRIFILGHNSRIRHMINCNCSFCKAKRGEYSGENNPFWEGGISKLPYTQDWTEDLKDAIRKRDDYRCRLCCSPQKEIYKKLPIHHIDYNKENCDPYNLITLCNSCHTKTNFNRNKWFSFFNGHIRLKRIIAL